LACQTNGPTTSNGQAAAPDRGPGPSVAPAVATVAPTALAMRAAGLPGADLRSEAPTSAAVGSVPTVSAVPALSVERELRHIDYLAGEIGSRVAGSPAQARAVEYLSAQFESAGLAVEKQEFPFSANQDRRASLETVSTEAVSFQAQTLQNSPAGDVQAELVYADLATIGRAHV